MSLSSSAKLASQFLILVLVGGILANCGGGSSGGPSGVPVTGTVIIEGSPGVTSLAAEHEPNDTMGFANALGTLQASQPLIQSGTTRPKREAFWLENGRLFRGESPLTDAQPALRTSVSSSFSHLALGGGGTVYLATAEAPPKISRRQLRGGRTDREWIAPQVNDLLGMSEWRGVLVLLAGAPTARLHLVDGESGTPLDVIELPAGEWTDVTLGDDWFSGLPRLFLASRTSGVQEVPLVHGVAGWRIGPSESWVRWELVGTRLHFDGTLLSIADDSSGAWDFYQVDQPRIARWRGTVATPARPLTWTHSAGLDSFTFQQTLSSPREIQVAASGPGTGFALLVDRQGCLEGSENATLGFATFQGSQSLRLPAIDGASRTVDLVIGSLDEVIHYRVGFGMSVQAPSDSEAVRPRADPLPRAARFLDGQAILRSYAQPDLPSCLEDCVVLRSREADQSLPPMTRSARFELSPRELSPSGLRIVDYHCLASPFAADRWNGTDLPASLRRNACREMLLLQEELRAEMDLEWCEPVYRARTLAVIPDDTFYSRQSWQFELMQLPDAWMEETGSDDVVVAVVDTGIRSENADILPRLQAGYDFVSELANSGDGDRRDADPRDEGTFEENLHHGTHMSGIIGAVTDNDFGVAGVMWDCQLIPCRALGVDGTGLTIDIAEGILFAAGLSNSSGQVPERTADVINLSVGLEVVSNAVEDAMRAAVNRGIVVVAGAGNDGVEGVLYPASSFQSIGVGAVNGGKARAEYSNTGNALDVMAPGGDAQDFDADGFADMVFSTVGTPAGETGSFFAGLAGTSMATAHVSGLAGLMKSVDRELDLEDVRAFLRSSAEDLGPDGFDTQTGFGLVRADRALVDATPVLALTASSLDFGINGTQLLVQANNIGGGVLRIEDLDTSLMTGPSGGWLRAEVESDGRTITILADRGDLADGLSQIVMTVESNGGEADVLVSITGSSDPLPDVGDIQVELLDADQNVVSMFVTTVLEDYEFALGRVQIGDFFLRCGIDADDDGELCEAGESCGFYPSVGAPATLELGGFGNAVIDVRLEAP